MQSSEVGGNRRVIAWTLGLCLLVLLAVPAFAQESGSVLGVVKDASGGVVPNAKLTITNTATAESRSATTGADGAYRFAGLRPGTYTLKIEAQGFQTQTLTDLILNVAADLVTNATLQVGAATQEVTVTGEAPVINTTTSSLGNLVNDQTISELPLNGRNYTDLTLLAPGVVQTTHSGLGDSGTWFSSNGAPPRSNNYMLDGAITVTKNGTGPASTTGSTLGVDGIKEYKLVTNSFSAEYGLLMGSQMIMVSKGGTNKWSGSLFEYLRNNHLDARNFFDPQPDKANNILTNANGDLMRNPQFKRNNFGGSFGGPIQKDKTFFFFVYEGLRLQQGDTIQTTSMPLACHVVNNGEDTILVGGGDISAADLAKLQTKYPNISHQILQGPLSGTTTLADVSGLGLATENCLGQAAGHVVDPLVQPWIGQFPFPNENLTGTSSNYTFDGQSHARDDYAQLRVDHNFSANDSFFSRYTIDDGLITTPYLGGNLSAADTGPAYPQYTNVGRSRNQYITLGENHIFSPVLLNSFRLSFSRMIYNNNFTQQNTPMNPDFFLQDNDPSKCYYIVPGDSAHQTPSCIWSFVPGKFTGGFNPGSGVTALTPPGTFPNYHYNNVWTLDDDLFFTHGKHAFKFGTLITRMNQPHLQSKSVFGAITFGNINNFLNGIAQNYNQVVPGTTVSDPSCVDYLPCPTLNSDFGNSNFLDRDHTARPHG
jgi:Carboxypeptidase regulatory-like domain